MTKNHIQPGAIAQSAASALQAVVLHILSRKINFPLLPIQEEPVVNYL